MDLKVLNGLREEIFTKNLNENAAKILIGKKLYNLGKFNDHYSFKFEGERFYKIKKFSDYKISNYGRVISNRTSKPRLMKLHNINNNFLGSSYYALSYGIKGVSAHEKVKVVDLYYDQFIKDCDSRNYYIPNKKVSADYKKPINHAQEATTFSTQDFDYLDNRVSTVESLFHRKALFLNELNQKVETFSYISIAFLVYYLLIL